MTFSCKLPPEFSWLNLWRREEFRLRKNQKVKRRHKKSFEKSKRSRAKLVLESTASSIRKHLEVQFKYQLTMLHILKRKEKEEQEKQTPILCFPSTLNINCHSKDNHCEYRGPLLLEFPISEQKNIHRKLIFRVPVWKTAYFTLKKLQDIPMIVQNLKKD